MGVVEVNGIRMHAHHGCMPEETAIGGPFQVDVRLECDFSEAVENDDLSKTVDYVDVHRIVRREMAIPSKLIEHVGGRILKALKEEISMIESCTVRLIKFNPPIGGQSDFVAIEVKD